ncbi:hypothetical protein M422DRAFT_252777 [Sphaerobolus stellatus SS14]|uniref:Uncharacterized protein n=1 Tax=Sphaerobolus stellatus (strain SS14) TaxID=990650 RepID=A0A0C9VZ92_SPHS4|nr:hypothetical protein M422DRAFT_252777 [Sphaerobolus stellatus SS14]
MLKLEAIRQSGFTIPPVPIPRTQAEALNLQFQLSSLSSSTQMVVLTEPSVPLSLLTEQESPVARAAATVQDLFNKSDTNLRASEDEDALSDTESITMDAGDEFDFSLLKSVKIHASGEHKYKQHQTP